MQITAGELEGSKENNKDCLHFGGSLSFFFSFAVIYTDLEKIKSTFDKLIFQKQCSYLIVLKS